MKFFEEIKGYWGVVLKTYIKHVGLGNFFPYIRGL